jgi:hypothetical protein
MKVDTNQLHAVTTCPYNRSTIQPAASMLGIHAEGLMSTTLHIQGLSIK